MTMYDYVWLCIQLFTLSFMEINIHTRLELPGFVGTGPCLHIRPLRKRIYKLFKVCCPLLLMEEIVGHQRYVQPFCRWLFHKLSLQSDSYFERKSCWHSVGVVKKNKIGTSSILPCRTWFRNIVFQVRPIGHLHVLGWRQKNRRVWGSFSLETEYSLSWRYDLQMYEFQSGFGSNYRRNFCWDPKAEFTEKTSFN